MKDPNRSNKEESVEDKDAILVRNAFKRYGRRKKKQYVLTNFNMYVRKGTIYGLLGPSGAGKTTLLSCIIGQKKLNSGEIWVLGGKPGRRESCVPGRCVGYMPQELALYMEFSLQDMLFYFGRLYGMRSAEITSRMKFLMELLELKSKTRKVKNLSGGQQRRVSLAVALVHEPELLILDEPTVGVDPVLREVIWKHLENLVKKQKTTVVITTHYIEEARGADRIGLMRAGEMLAEDTPTKLLETYKQPTLEGVFLKLAYTQGNIAGPAHVSVQDPDDLFKNKIRRKIHRQQLTLRVKQMGALLQKNFLQLWRNPGIILFFLGLPIVQIILFCMAIGGEPTDLKIAVVNREMPNVKTTEDCTFQKGCTTSHLSCRYLHEFEKTIADLTYFSTIKEARDAVKKGNAWGLIYFNDKFSESLLMKQIQPNDDNRKKSQIIVNPDTSNQQLYFMLQRDIYDAYYEFSKKMLKDCNRSVDSMDTPVSIEKPIYGTTKPSFRNFSAPGIIITIVFFLSVGQTAIVLISEQHEGMLERTQMAGVSAVQLLLSHVIFQFIILSCQTSIVLFFTLEVFYIRCEGSILLVICLALLQGVCGMCFGYVISAACDVERTAIQIALGSFYPSILLSGVIWPVEGMHIVMQYISYFTPLTFSITAIRNIMGRGWGITYRPVYLGIIAPLLWITFFLTLVILILKFKHN